MGLRERPVLLLQFRKEPHVLDGDDRLVGEGFEQGDLIVREATEFATGHRDRSDSVVVTEYR